MLGSKTLSLDADSDAMVHLQRPSGRRSLLEGEHRLLRAALVEGAGLAEAVGFEPTGVFADFGSAFPRWIRIPVP